MEWRKDMMVSKTGPLKLSVTIQSTVQGANSVSTIFYVVQAFV